MQISSAASGLNGARGLRLNASFYVGIKPGARSTSIAVMHGAIACPRHAKCTAAGAWLHCTLDNKQQLADDTRLECSKPSKRSVPRAVHSGKRVCGVRRRLEEARGAALKLIHHGSLRLRRQRCEQAPV